MHPSLANENLLDVLQLIRTLNVGPITFFNLIKQFGSAKESLKALPELSRRGGSKMGLVPFQREVAEKEIENCKKFGAKMLMYGNPEYPALLLNIADPPPIITVRGDTQIWLNKTIIAMVGARNASAGGCQFAQKLAKDLGEKGALVVSGLARGIDTFVHKGSLATGTVAVIAGGIDNIYPHENEALYKMIFEQGAVISEQPFSSAPFAGSFPGRNRIIAGMSVGTVVVEAAPKSGSLITARFALENNREVFAVPGSPLDPRSKGCNNLIKQGATMAESASDIIEGIAHIRQPNLFEATTSTFTQPPFINTLNEDELEKLRQKIVDKLSSYAVSIDELIEQCDTTASAMQTILLELELAGRVKRSTGNKVYLINQIEEVA
ncbi:MAG: DNA-processing protein DprA [Rickettsiales bacterium]|jgi:DNA processing protein